MERVETLLKKLQEQFAQKAPPAQLLLTVQMLQAELLHLSEGLSEQADHFHTMENVAITVSHIAGPKDQPEKNNVAAEPEEKIVEVLKVDEAEIEAELEEIKRNAEAMQKMSLQNKPHIQYQPEEEEDIPTLSHQNRPKPARPEGGSEPPKKEINESVTGNTASINERLKQSKIDLGDTFTEVPIRDLRKAIAVNDRFLFINELFRGDEIAYERSIKTINSFSIFPEAEYWIQRELKVKNGWNDSDELVRQFYQLVKRRFS
jgi:hypothetical protein